MLYFTLSNSSKLQENNYQKPQEKRKNWGKSKYNFTLQYNSQHSPHSQKPQQVMFQAPILSSKDQQARLNSIILNPLWLPLTFLILKNRAPTFSGKKIGLELHQKTTDIIQSQSIFLSIFSWYHFCSIFVEGYKI